MAGTWGWAKTLLADKKKKRKDSLGEAARTGFEHTSLPWLLRYELYGSKPLLVSYAQISPEGLAFHSYT